MLRIPIVRLTYGTKIFDWGATVQTGMVLSVYAIGIVTQTLMSILSRAFFALHDTKTPVKISFIGLGLLVAFDFLLVLRFHLPVWALAASFSFSTFVEAIFLLALLDRRVGDIVTRNFLGHLMKIAVATLISGSSMYFLIKFFDRSVWIKQLSFISGSAALSYLPFERFVLDTRYTGNLFILTFMTFFIGMAIYLGLSLLFRVEEARYFLGVARKLLAKKLIPSVPVKEQEPISPTTGDTQEQ